MVRNFTEFWNLRLALGRSDSHTCGIGYVDGATGNWIDVPVKSATVVPVLGGATGTAYFDLIQLMQFSPGPAAVTFMFDDGYKSTRSVAKPTLDKYRFVGSAAAISSVVGTSGNMTAQDLGIFRRPAGTSPRIA